MSMGILETVHPPSFFVFVVFLVAVVVVVVVVVFPRFSGASRTTPGDVEGFESDTVLFPSVTGAMVETSPRIRR